MLFAAGCRLLALDSVAPRKQPEEMWLLEAGEGLRAGDKSPVLIPALLLACYGTVGNLFTSLGLCCLYTVRKWGFIQKRAGTQLC